MVQPMSQLKYRDILLQHAHELSVYAKDMLYALKAEVDQASLSYTPALAARAAWSFL